MDATGSPSRARIIVGVDGSLLSREALRWAFRYAAQSAGTLHAVHAWTYPAALSLDGEYLLPNVDMARGAVERLRRIVQDELGAEAAATVEAEAPFGVPGPLLVERATGATLLVVGASGGNPLSRAGIGSTSAYVVQHAACPVVVCRPAHRAHSAECAPAAALTTHAREGR